MTKQLVKVAALCVVGLLAGRALAQADADAPARRRGDRPQARRGKGPQRADRAKATYDKLIEELKLTEKQDAPVRQILETYREEMANWLKQNGPTLRDLQMKLRGGRGGRRDTGNEKPAKPASDADRKKAMEQYRELMAQRAEKTENVLKQLKDHLTEEQMAIATKLLGGRGRRARGPALWALRQLDLTADQQKQVRGALTAVREAAEGTDRQAAAKAYAEAWDKIVKDVLTDEQRAKLKELEKQGPPRAGAAGGMLPGVELTAEQQKQVQEIRESYRKKIADAEGAEAKREVYTAMRKEIEAVLTPEQREKLQQNARQRRERMMRQRGASRGAGRRPRPAKDAPPIVE